MPYFLTTIYLFNKNMFYNINFNIQSIQDVELLKSF